MTRITYYSTPRQAGKTNLALYEAIKNHGSSLIVAHNTAHAKELEKKWDHLRTTSYNVFAHKNNSINIRGLEILILDEYHFATLHQRVELYGYVMSNLDKLREVIVLTTPTKQIPIELYKYVAQSIAYGVTLAQAIEPGRMERSMKKFFLLPIHVESLQVMIHELWYDLIFLDCDRNNVGKLSLKFHDGEDRLPFFNYGTREREFIDRDMGISEAEITGQYIVK